MSNQVISRFSCDWYEEKLTNLDKNLTKMWNVLSIRERRKFLVFVRFQDLQKQIYKAKVENKNNSKGISKNE